MSDEITRLKEEFGKSNGNSSQCEQGSGDEPLLEEEQEFSLD